MPRTRPSDETISVTTRPQPPCRLTRRRNAVSVMPAIGATTNGDGSATLPIFIGATGPGASGERGSVGPDIGGVDLDADSLPDQIDGQDEACVRALPEQAADNP